MTIDRTKALEAARVAIKDTIDVLCWLDRGGGLGYEKHERIRSEIASLMAARALLAEAPGEREKDNSAAAGAAPFPCAAKKSVLPEPADCDWPFCGCDAHAIKVIAALQESGWVSPRELASKDVNRRAPSWQEAIEAAAKVADDWCEAHAYVDPGGASDIAGLIRALLLSVANPTPSDAPKEE